ncbi:MAG: polyribonucleotide nucleotidyltransferase [Candidatus Latescibacteria bacterium]|nr:polyribonucleotide nucleotidyltransferase [Candidatus Latescibacterota bacterium]
MIHRTTLALGGQSLILETGRLAKQAHGSVWVQYGETVAMVTVCRSHTPTDRDFFPLTVEYREKAYAAGKIPGNIFKREGKPSDNAILAARLVDHAIRPCFPRGLPYEIQVYISVLSIDGHNPPDVLGLLGASAALCLSDIPFTGPLGAVRVGRVDGAWLVNPTNTQLEDSDVDLIVSGTADSIASVEGGADEIDEADLLQALKFGHRHIQQLVAFQDELVALAGRPKMAWTPPELPAGLADAVAQAAGDAVAQANRTEGKEAREQALRQLRTQVLETLAQQYPNDTSALAASLDDLVKTDMRQMVLQEQRRIDGRSLNQVRPVDCANALLPRSHGSALFTRGQTQALCTATLGTRPDERMVDDLSGKHFKPYYLDYNFPSYSVGEVRRETGPKWREIGHGHLAERALEPVIPSDEVFPYTIRLVSDITESNSSSSMATVCGCSLALMDAGVPVRTAVAGAGVGLVKEGNDWALLTDIQGAEDFLGDMDLKVAGTEKGITAIQMDIKIKGIAFDLLEHALEQAFNGRMHILQIMNQCLASPRDQLSEHAPRIETIKIDPSKIGAVIGPGGKMIRRIEESGAKVDVADDGTIALSSSSAPAVAQARSMVEALTSDAEIGREYQGTVKTIKAFGAFVEILPGKDGLLHISELAHRPIDKVEDVVKEGDRIAVKILDIDTGGKIRLSHKATL